MELKEATYKSTEIGLIPEDWSDVRIGEILKIKHGKSQKEVESSNGAYPIYGTGGLMGYATDFLYDKESVLIGRKGTIDKPRYLDTPFWTVDTLFYSEIKEGVVAKLIYYNFLMIDWYSHNEASGVPSLNGSKIEKIRIPLPPTQEEQQAIANALSDVDTLVSKLDKLIAKKKAIKQGAMQRLLKSPAQGGQRLPDFEGEWKEVKLGDIGDCIIGLTYSPSNVKDSGTLVLRSSNIQNMRLALEDNVYVQMDIPQKLITQVGDILICVRNGSRNLIGKCIRIDERVAGQSFGAFMSIYRTKYSEYISQAFQSEIIQKQIEANLGATINQITNKTLNSFVISIPTDEKEIKAIGSILSDMDKEIEKLEANKSKYLHIKQGMMQELLTGKTRLV
ncbi:restriction endonuclease subunit S [Fulvivirga sp.]|uniref:restriction endonuclease subunit S n=1 Tax=Fulvivirga sp. TaxID=1931237 RepID=UPI0032EFF207